MINECSKYDFLHKNRIECRHSRTRSSSRYPGSSSGSRGGSSGGSSGDCSGGRSAWLYSDAVAAGIYVQGKERHDLRFGDDKKYKSGKFSIFLYRPLEAVSLVLFVSIIELKL